MRPQWNRRDVLKGPVATSSTMFGLKQAKAGARPADPQVEIQITPIMSQAEGVPPFLAPLSMIATRGAIALVPAVMRDDVDIDGAKLIDRTNQLEFLVAGQIAQLQNFQLAERAAIFGLISRELFHIFATSVFLSRSCCRALLMKGWSIKAPSEPPEPGLPWTNGRVQVGMVAFANTLEQETSSDPFGGHAKHRDHLPFGSARQEKPWREITFHPRVCAIIPAVGHRLTGAASRSFKDEQ